MPDEPIYNELDNDLHNEGNDGAFTVQPPEKESENDPVEKEGGKGNRASAAGKAATTRQKSADKVGASAGKRKSTKKLKEYTIMLNDSSQFPPGGLTLGLNGTFKTIPAEVPVKLNQNWMEILNHATQTEPRVDDNGRIIGVRNVPRFPYRIVPDEEE